MPFVAFLRKLSERGKRLGIFEGFIDGDDVLWGDGEVKPEDFS
jgi:hypothetical protein